MCRFGYWRRFLVKAKSSAHLKLSCAQPHIRRSVWSFVYSFPDYIFGVAKIQRAPIRLEGWLSRLL